MQQPFLIFKHYLSTMKIFFFLLTFTISSNLWAQSIRFPLKRIALEDSTHAKHKLSQLTGNQPLVTILLTPECPITQKYTPIIRSLSNQFPTVKFLLIFTKWDDWQDIKAFQKEYPLSILAYKDFKNQFVKKIDATVTPEVFFFDKNHVLLYRGCIDNWFYSLGKHRQEPTECYLEDAINAHLKGELIKIKETNALGCIIEK
jgi:thiol-disulfide isomerase/thioredoxin